MRVCVCVSLYTFSYFPLNFCRDKQNVRTHKYILIEWIWGVIEIGQHIILLSIMGPFRKQFSLWKCNGNSIYFPSCMRYYRLYYRLSLASAPEYTLLAEFRVYATIRFPYYSYANWANSTVTHTHTRTHLHWQWGQRISNVDQSEMQMKKLSEPGITLSGNQPQSPQSKRRRERVRGRENRRLTAGYAGSAARVQRKRKSKRESENRWMKSVEKHFTCGFIWNLKI